MRRRVLAVTVALMLGTATMTPDVMARGGAGHGFGSVHGGHGFGYGRGHGYGRYGRGYGYGYGLYWYPPFYEYDNGASDAVGDITSGVAAKTAPCAHHWQGDPNSPLRRGGIPPD